MERISSFVVCIRCVTYNHEPFILDSMNGFVMQKTDFPFVAVFVDDASTDNTPQVITSYFDSHFDTKDSSIAYQEECEFGKILFARHKLNKNCYFAVVFLKENHFKLKISKNRYFCRWSDNANYIALCEGDDYWIDSHKLQKQVSYLEQHKECDMIACSSYWSINGVLYERNYASKEPRVLSVSEVISGGGSFIPTCSLLFSHRYLDDIPEWRRIANVGDYPLQIQGALEGKLFYLPEAMCVYRRGQKGSWANRYYNNPDIRLNHQRAELTWMEELDRSTGHRYQKEIYGRFSSSIHILFRNKKASIREYCHCVRLVGSASDKKRMIKNIIKRLIHYNC